MSSYDYKKQLHGLCLSFHHLNQTEVGSRRFRSLLPYFNADGIMLDVIAGYSPNLNPEKGTTTAGIFSPFSSALNWLWKLKCQFLPSNSYKGKGSELQFSFLKSVNLGEITKDNSLRSFVLSFDQLPDQHAGWILPVVLKALRKRNKYDFVISTAPPWSSHIASIFIGWLLNIPVILDERDPWVGSPGRMTRITHPLIRRIDKYIAHYCYSKASGIVFVTDAALNLYKEELISNTIPTECFPSGYNSILDEQYCPSVRTDELTFTYVGSTYHGRSPLIILEAARMLGEDISKDFHFHFIGTISQPEINAINTLDKKFKVTLHGYKSHEYCIKTVNNSDVCLLMAIGQPVQIPAKVYEYIGLGRPILSLSEPNDATMQLLEDKKWAWTVVSKDRTGLTQVLTDIHQRWKVNNLPQLKQHGEREEYSFKRVADGYSKFIRQVVQNAKQEKD